MQFAQRRLADLVLPQSRFLKTFFQTKGDRPLDDIIAEHASKLQKKSLLFSASNTQLSSMQKVSRFFKLKKSFEKRIA